MYIFLVAYVLYIRRILPNLISLCCASFPAIAGVSTWPAALRLLGRGASIDFRHRRGRRLVGKNWEEPHEPYKYEQEGTRDRVFLIAAV